MRRIPPRLALAVLTAVCMAASCAQVGQNSLANLQHDGTILVRPRPGASYRRLTSGGTVAVLHLVKCRQPPHDDNGHGSVGSGHSSARNEAGDVLEIPPGGAPPGARIDVTRKRARDFRIVEASASAPVTSARLGIDLTRCRPSTGTTVVRRDSAGWTDMGGTVAGSVVTADLPHLSIYAVAGN